MLSTSVAMAEAVNPACESVLQACDTALDAKDHELDLANLAITQSKAQNELLTQQVQDANAKLDAWYRSPYLYLIVGILAGGYVAKK